MQDNWPAEELLRSRKEHCPESISIIIPALNEESLLPSTLESTRSSRPPEVVLVDGGSVDGTQGVASRYSAKILFSPPTRARQMNCGAAAASGSVLLFLHADTRLPRHFEVSCANIIRVR
jgi:uncharacterized protein